MNELIARVAYINAQVACMLAELEAMKARNAQDRSGGCHPTFTEDDFRGLPDRMGVHHNAVVSYLVGQ